MDRIMGEHWQRVEAEAQVFVGLGWSAPVTSSVEFWEARQLEGTHCGEYQLKADKRGKLWFVNTNPLTEGS